MSILPENSRISRRRFANPLAAENGDGVDALEALAQRFPLSARREVRRLVRTSPRLADLANVFPGALFAIASKRGPAGQRLEAVSLIEKGASLKSVARVLDLPLWLRRLPPEAFSESLPAMPATDTFARRIANRLPANAGHSAPWLQSVAFAATASHEDFAIWLAEQRLYSEPLAAEKLFAVLAAYAWFSRAPGTRGHALIVVPWRPEIAFDTAICAAKSWFNRVRLLLQLGPGVLNDGWLNPGEAMGLSFVPLLDASAILLEAQAMQNCADQYAERLANDRCRLFSVRRNGTRIATLEIGPHSRETGFLTITQLKTRHNLAAAHDVWAAAYAWMSAQTALRRIPCLVPPERRLNAGLWSELLEPYREKTGGAPWLPATPATGLFAALDSYTAELARRGGVTSWLFT